MNHLSLTRSHFHQTHNLSPDTLASHPDTAGRILYFTLPYLFAVIINIALFSRNLRIHQNNFIKTYPSRYYIFVAFLITLVGTGVFGLYAVLADAWTVKQWIIFTVICVLIGLKSLIYTADTNATIVITALVTILASVITQWLFIDLRGLSEANQDQIGWKHVTRNLLGFIEALLIILSVEYLSESLVYAFKISSKVAGIFFWAVSILAVTLVLVWNIISFGPFLDLIGYIVAALILFLGAAVNNLFHIEEDRDTIPLKK
jgi:hypothetical protein